MSVAENVGYGLRIRKVPPAERERRVGEALEMVRLPGVGARRPSQLSGGQRQRVALARCAGEPPRVLLLDEPLGALDLKLRQQMQLELTALQEQLGITFVHVTHDQEEALAMSDRLAVFRDGHLEQVGTPAEVYEHPATPFVADFVGVSNRARGPRRRKRSRAPRARSPYAPRRSACCPRPPYRSRRVLGHRPHPRRRLSGDAHALRDRGRDGTVLTVVEQNRETTAADVHRHRGRAVRLAWNPAHNHVLGA
jgi:putative spermidine/putrescine transport system ATP-binding protein